MSVSLWLPHVKPLSLSLLSVPVYKGCNLELGVGRERMIAHGLQGSICHFLSSFWKETLHFWISSFLHYEGNRRKNGERQKNGEKISDTEKYASENFNLGNKGVIK